MMFHLRGRKRLLKIVLLAALQCALVFFFYSLIRFSAFRAFGFDVSSHEIVILFVSVLTAVVFYKPCDHLIFLFFKEVLFRSHTRDYSILLELTHAMRTTVDLKELGGLVVRTFSEVWGIRTVSVLTFNPDERFYRVAASSGFDPEEAGALRFMPSQPLVELLRVRRLPVERERTARAFSWQEANQLTYDFERLHASLIIPMFFEDVLVGMVNLFGQAGIKKLVEREMKAFVDFGREAAIAFRNAALFEELRKSNEQLMSIQSELLFSAQHSAIAQLAVGIAHEIHNPLTIISGKAQVLLLKKEKIAYDAQVEEVLKTIVKQTKRAADITRKLLMFSDTQRSTKELVDFEILINDTIALLSYQVSLDQIQVLKRFTHSVPKFRANVAELREAFLNLFLNAVRAIGTKGTIEIGILYRAADRIIEISIADTGAGIAEEYLSRVFQPFFTTHEGATGLGLFVTQQIVRGYKGTIRAERNKGKGATFIIEFPVELEPAAAETGGCAEGEMRAVSGAPAILKKTPEAGLESEEVMR